MSRRRSTRCFAQTHGRVEAVIVNDGSFEEADEVLVRLAERPGVRVVTQLNGGEATARNLAVQLAEGEYLMMLDADNVLEPEFVARALEVFRREPDAGLRLLLAAVHRAGRLPVSRTASGAPTSATG